MGSEVTGSSFSPSLVAVLCHDAPDSAEARRSASRAHLRWVESMLERIALAGPLYSEEGGEMIGSLYLFRTRDLDEARRWLESDPYFQAGFWSRIEFRPFLPAAGDLIGGTVW